MEVIKQKHYADLSVDTSEKDIVQIWFNETMEINLVQIERENIEKLIEILKGEIKK